MKYYDLIIGIGAFVVAHVLTFFQLNGQFFKMDWFRKHEIWVAAAGIILSFFYIWGTKYAVISLMLSLLLICIQVLWK